jgi:hypothetical protein
VDDRTHRLSGTALNPGADRLAAAGEAIEDPARLGQVLDVSTMEGMAEELGLVAVVLRAEISRRS